MIDSSSSSTHLKDAISAVESLLGEACRHDYKSLRRKQSVLVCAVDAGLAAMQHHNAGSLFALNLQARRELKNKQLQLPYGEGWWRYVKVCESAALALQTGTGTCATDAVEGASGARPSSSSMRPWRCPHSQSDARSNARSNAKLSATDKCSTIFCSSPVCERPMTRRTWPRRQLFPGTWVASIRPLKSPKSPRPSNQRGWQKSMPRMLERLRPCGSSATFWCCSCRPV